MHTILSYCLITRKNIFVKNKPKKKFLNMRFILYFVLFLNRFVGTSIQIKKKLPE